MQTERIVLRPRLQSEAMDLGLHLARANWPALAGLTTIALLLPALLAALVFTVYPALALLVLWWFKPSIDRPLLHLLSRDLIGQSTRVRDVLVARPDWWRGGHLATLTAYRFHPARSTVLPIWQLERLRGPLRRKRARGLGHGNSGAGTGLTLMTALFEATLVIGLIVLLSWLLPDELWSRFEAASFWDFGTIAPEFWALLAITYALTIILIEPFYVGAGFGLYLNQRCRLECWDLEPPLRSIARKHAKMATGSRA
jgi:ABC-type sugar transport system permease subunit